MKKLFAIAILATAFTFTSCGGGSLPNKVADCICGATNTALKMKKEIAAAPADKKAELEAKAMETMKTPPACLAAIDEDRKKLEADTSAAGKAKREAIGKEVEAAIEKKCGAAMKELSGM